MEAMVREIDIREQLEYDWERGILQVKSILQKNRKKARFLL